MQETLGNIRANRMIYTQTILIPASLIYCFFNTDIHDRFPSIVEIAKTYPNCIVFRIGMLYSMFLMFLQTLFIHWWIATEKDKQEIKQGVHSSFPLGLMAVVSYAIFGSCIDTKRINYTLVKYSSFVAYLSFTFLIFLINKNIKTLLVKNPHFVTGSSWRYKKILGNVNLALFIFGVLLYTGNVSIKYQDILPYPIIITIVLYFFTFVLDFKKKYMGVDVSDWENRPIENANIVQQPRVQLNESQQLSEPNYLNRSQNMSYNQYLNQPIINNGGFEYPTH